MGFAVYNHTHLLHSRSWGVRQHVGAQEARNKGSSNSCCNSADSPPVLTPAGVHDKCQEGYAYIACEMLFMPELPLKRDCSWCNTCWALTTTADLM